MSETGKEQAVTETKATKVKTFPVRLEAKVALCDCGGEMVWVISEEDNPVDGNGRLHQCQECGGQARYDRFYPDIIKWIVMPDGTEKCYNVCPIVEAETEEPA